MTKQAYTAGKYTAETRTQEIMNIHAALVAACALTKKGWKPIVPHVSGSHLRTWEEAMNDCRAIIQGMNPRTDCLVLIPGWEESVGAREEAVLARDMGLPIFLLEDIYEVGA